LGEMGSATIKRKESTAKLITGIVGNGTTPAFQKTDPQGKTRSNKEIPKVQKREGRVQGKGNFSNGTKEQLNGCQCHEQAAQNRSFRHFLKKRRAVHYPLKEDSRGSGRAENWKKNRKKKTITEDLDWVSYLVKAVTIRVNWGTPKKRDFAFGFILIKFRGQTDPRGGGEEEDSRKGGGGSSLNSYRWGGGCGGGGGGGVGGGGVVVCFLFCGGWLLFCCWGGVGGCWTKKRTY